MKDQPIIGYDPGSPEGDKQVAVMFDPKTNEFTLLKPIPYEPTNH